MANEIIGWKGNERIVYPPADLVGKTVELSWGDCCTSGSVGGKVVSAVLLSGDSVRFEFEGGAFVEGSGLTCDEVKE